MVSKILLYEIAKETQAMRKADKFYNLSGQERFLAAKVEKQVSVDRLLKKLEKQEFEN